jgi:DNA-directed RNA polymerase sigma subunit (sigma70/sigma32)
LLRDKNLRDEVSDLLEVLDDRERRIIFQRFGLDDGKPKTLEEVGGTTLQEPRSRVIATLLTERLFISPLRFALMMQAV